MNSPTDHELKKVLADVAGVEVIWIADANQWHRWPPSFGDDTWNPLIDANQMMLVKTKLRRQVQQIYVNLGVTCLVVVQYENNEHESIYARGEHEDELRAFALAVYTMTKGGG